MTITTIDELEDIMAKMVVSGVSVHFGPSTSPLRQGQWFASTGTSDTMRQVRGPTLRDALNALLGFQDVVDVITEPAKAAPSRKPAATNLMDLLA
jgi:hypothetical protein